MDWASQINQFKALSVDSVPLFASPGEMEQAVSIYNKAINNWQQDSQDIAMISLRKLAASYPLFPQPALMLGYCLASWGDYKEAAQWIDQAIHNNLPEDLHDSALQSLSSLNDRLESADPEQKGSTPQQKAKRVLLPGTAGVLEKTRRHRAVRMASDREKKRLIRQGDLGDEPQTNIREPFNLMDRLHLLIPVVAVLIIVALLVLTITVWIPNRNKRQADQASDSERLVWLLDRMEALSSKNIAVSDLLKTYQETFVDNTTPSQSTTQTQTEAMPTPTAEPTAEPTPSPEPTVTPEPTPEPTLDPAHVALLEASEQYEEAVLMLSSDLTGAADRLLTARTLLADLPDLLSIDSVAETAGELRQKVDNQIADIAVSAANRFRLLAEPEFRREQYDQALVYYLKAYALNPNSYGGGVAYYTGRCYQLLDDPEAAKPYYEYVVDTFAGRDIANSAAYRLSEMGY